jgi:DNA-binding NtrC family response regulator
MKNGQGNSSGGEILLVVDDDSQVCELIKEGLENPGITVVLANNGLQARQINSSLHPPVILLDIGLPDVSGLTLLDEFMKADPSLMVVMLTGQADEGSVVEAMRKGALDYISKPFRIAEVRSKVESAFVRARRNREAPDMPDGKEPAGMESGVIIGKSPCMMEVFKQIGRLAASPVPVLITGESGTGKELVAKSLHKHGPRPNGPFITVDCAGIPVDLLESELFGYERGAFTGSVGAKPGRLEMANGGTLFIDEVGNIPPAIQPKLLRALQEKTSQRLGSNTAIKWDARIITATNSDLHKLASAGLFREDLIFRIAGGEIPVPPIRERKGDIPILAGFFLARQGGTAGVCSLSPEALGLMEAYRWPGNVRELEHAMSHASTLARGGVIGPEDLPEKVRLGAVEPGQPEGASPFLTMDDMKSRHAEAVLRDCAGNKTEAARRLGIDRKTLNSFLKKPPSPA